MSLKLAGVINQINNVLPPTWYADRDTAFRVRKMVEGWQKAVLVASQMDEIEAHIATALEQARIAIDSLKWLTNEYDGSNFTLTDQKASSAQVGVIAVIEQLTAAIAKIKGE